MRFLFIDCLCSDRRTCVHLFFFRSPCRLICVPPFDNPIAVEARRLSHGCFNTALLLIIAYNGAKIKTIVSVIAKAAITTMKEVFLQRLFNTVINVNTFPTIPKVTIQAMVASTNLVSDFIWAGFPPSVRH